MYVVCTNDNDDIAEKVRIVKEHLAVIEDFAKNHTKYFQMVNGRETVFVISYVNEVYGAPVLNAATTLSSMHIHYGGIRCVRRVPSVVIDGRTYYDSKQNPIYQVDLQCLRDYVANNGATKSKTKRAKKIVTNSANGVKDLDWEEVCRELKIQFSDLQSFEEPIVILCSGFRSKEIPILLQGEPGSGKTFLAKSVLEIVESKGGLVREYYAPAVTADALFRDLREFVETHGRPPHLIFLDELDKVKLDHVRSTMLSLFDSNRRRLVKGGEVIDLSETVIIAAANKLGDNKISVDWDALSDRLYVQNMKIVTDDVLKILDKSGIVLPEFAKKLLIENLNRLSLRKLLHIAKLFVALDEEEKTESRLKRMIEHNAYV